MKLILSGISAKKKHHVSSRNDFRNLSTRLRIKCYEIPVSHKKDVLILMITDVTV